MASVIQWNIRGLRANYNELLILMQSFQPVAFCLQELKISNLYQFPNRQYSLVSKLPDMDNSNKPSGGSGNLIRKDIPRSKIKLDSSLQAVACRISLPEPISVCSVYLPPSSTWNCNDLLLFLNCLHLSYSWETSTRTARCGVAAPPARKGSKLRTFGCRATCACSTRNLPHIFTLELKD
jgi:exonuclease III